MLALYKIYIKFRQLPEYKDILGNEIADKYINNITHIIELCKKSKTCFLLVIKR